MKIWVSGDVLRSEYSDQVCAKNRHLWVPVAISEFGGKVTYRSQCPNCGLVRREIRDAEGDVEVNVANSVILYQVDEREVV